MSNYQKTLNDLLSLAIINKASDIHFTPNRRPILRIDGQLKPIDKQDPLLPEEVRSLVEIMLSKENYQKLLQQKELDFSYEINGKGRFRGNAYYQRGTISCALRFVSTKIRTIEELNLPPIFHLFARATQGFVLVTGPSSHGKSTTLAAVIDEVNHTRTDHVITIEDPIEYIFENDLAIIDQREVDIDTKSFENALRSTFRQDPDVIMVGEMRDAETIATAITAAETGHLVFATLHTNSASQTIHRIVDSFEGSQQMQIRAQLSGSLLAVVSQRLIPGAEGGMIPACEIMLNSPAVSNLIRENKIHEIPLIISTSIEDGMITLNQSIAHLVKNNKVKIEDAYNFSPNISELKELLKR
ncbi:MAG: PilT/PilU family type 4a pilus ATPase [Candidatus Paceibacterota bacterium]|jgi:twitching motility protein PilT|nr:PilT/PilU family type 4a pilus ATPase [Candidatus Paceibacterota bacterium]